MFEVGFQWSDKKIVAKDAYPDGAARYHVREGDLKATYFYSEDYLAKMVEVDQANEEFRKKEAEQEAKDQALAEQLRAEFEDVDGFDQGLSPMRRAKVLVVLNDYVRYKGNICRRKTMIRNLVAEGRIVVIGPDGQRWLEDTKTGLFMDEKALTKTGMNYAEHLIEKGEA